MIDIIALLSKAFEGAAVDSMKEAIKQGIGYLIKRGASDFTGYFLLGSWDGDLTDKNDSSFRQNGRLTAWLDGQNWISAIYSYRTYINGIEVARGADHILRIPVDDKLKARFDLTFERFIHTELSPVLRVVTDAANYQFKAVPDKSNKLRMRLATTLQGATNREIDGLFIKQQFGPEI
jgi:hypothetical protein